MSIIIKGMEMPKYDTFHLTLLDDGTVCDGVWGDVVAQAVELPPHGRLIDAEWLTEHMRNKYENGPFGWNPDEFDVLAVIEDAPTIVEAEVEE